MEFKEINVPECIVQQIDHKGPLLDIKKLLGVRFIPTGLVEKRNKDPLYRDY